MNRPQNDLSASSAELGSLRQRLPKLTQLHDLEEADRILESALQDSPNHPQLMDMYCEAARRRRDTHLWFSRASQFHEKHPDSAEAALSLAAVQIYLKRFDDAEQVSLAAFNRHPMTWKLFLMYARSAPPGSPVRVDRLRELQRLFPERPEPWSHLAQALRAIGEIPEADKIIDQALVQFPTSVALWMQKPLALRERGCWDEAIKWWEILSERFPGNAAILRQLNQDGTYLLRHKPTL